MISLRPEYQTPLVVDIKNEWARGARNVLAVLPTGGGKTVVMAHLMAECSGACLSIAHRQEIVSQMSLALARNGLRHRVIGSDSTQRACVSIHMGELGRSFYDPTAVIGVAGVDTLVRMDPNTPWFQQVREWHTDEAHHLLKANKWGKAVALFPNARGVGWTATPKRADGHGLGRHADGVMDSMVGGPSMRWLINNRFLTDYRIFAPPNALDLSDVPTSASGDYSPPAVREAVHKAQITGDVVAHYLRFAAGKLGVTFAVDVEDATTLAAAYRAAGVPAEVISAKTPDTVRIAILRRFRARQVMQLVNVDLFGEGFDLPAIEVCSMARPTQSFTLYAQQFGRALRLLEGKQHGLIIDHVGNVVRHGLPDRPRQWTLDRRERRAGLLGSDNIPIRICPACLSAYERIFKRCPYCAHVPVPAGRDSPDKVDGDLAELDAATLAALRGEVDRIDSACRLPRDVSPITARAIQNNHLDRQQHQATLRQWLHHWAWQQGDVPPDQVQRLFYFKFGIDVMSACALGAREADALGTRIMLSCQ